MDLACLNWFGSVTATRRLFGEGRFRSGLSYVTSLGFGTVKLTNLIGALNWATGETVAVKEITLSNIPKGELHQIMVSV